MSWIVRGILLLAIASVMAAGAYRAVAVQPDEVLSDPVLETRARNISAGLRCLVCQNQSIDDSDAPLARDLRLLVRERLKAGDSDSDVRSFLVERYGDFVLLKPPLSMRTLVLWLTPGLLLIGAFFVVRSMLRQPPTSGAGPTPGQALSAEEQAKLDVLLGKRD